MQSPLLQAEKVVGVSGEMSGGGNMSLIEVVLARKEKKKDKEDKIKRLSRKTEENKKRWHVKSPVFCYASVFVCASKAICRLVLDDPTGPVESEKSVAVFWGAFAATLLFTFLQRYVFGLAVRQAVDLARLKRREQSSRRKGGSLSSAQGQEEIKVQAEDDEQSDSSIDTWSVLKEIGSLCAPDWRLLAMAFVALSIGSAGTAAIPYGAMLSSRFLYQLVSVIIGLFSPLFATLHWSSPGKSSQCNRFKQRCRKGGWVDFKAGGCYHSYRCLHRASWEPVYLGCFALCCSAPQVAVQVDYGKGYQFLRQEQDWPDLEQAFGRLSEGY